MALITCKECGKSISDTTARCPNCGAPRSKAVGISSGRKTVDILGGIFFILLCIVSGFYPFYVGYPKDFPECFLASFVLLIIGITFIVGALKTPLK
jgi:hypothetical protein